MKKDDPYSEAVASGKYVRETGLHGKYDNVRVYWEDEATRIFLRPYLETVMKNVADQGRGIRILDLGCGSGDGYEMFMGMTKSAAPLNDPHWSLINEPVLAQYRGIELNEDLLKQNTERWGEDPKMSCTWGDFSQGLPVDTDEPSFDVYFASYGCFSHLHEPETVALMCDIARHAANGSIVLADWLGRYSYEWQKLWNKDLSSECWMDYYISYIYSEEQRRTMELTPLPLRLLSLEEVMRIPLAVKLETGIHLKLEALFDRSIFVGRHMDTNDYNAFLTPLRSQVNRLFERNVRTDFEKLLLEYHPESTFPSLNAFFNEFSTCWNTVVQATQAFCEAEQNGSSFSEESIPIPEKVRGNNILAKSIAYMQDVVLYSRYYGLEDVRSNVIEPQLGFALRDLEINLQRGAGMGHGYVGIFSVVKE